jgi:hypothetical protein
MSPFFNLLSQFPAIVFLPFVCVLALAGLIFVFVGLMFVTIIARVFIAKPWVSKPEAEQASAKTARTRTKSASTPIPTQPAKFSAQDADVFGLSLAKDRIASGLPEWQQYYGTSSDWE